MKENKKWEIGGSIGNNFQLAKLLKKHELQ